jgi:TRAP-type C4-dicarboxylate transport system permease large subunit
MVELLKMPEDDVKENQPEMKSNDFLSNEQALWLPPGSIRAIIALSTTAASIACVFVLGYIPDALMIINGYSLGFYFGGKSSVK